MRGTTSVEGIISGFDTTAIVTQLMAARRAAITQLQDRQTACSTKAAAWESINTALLALKTLAESLTTDEGLSPKTATSSDTSLLTATASASAQPTIADIIVNRLAQAHKIASASKTDPGQALDLSGDIIINGHTVTLAPSDTLSSLRTKINNADVTASILAISDSDYRLTLTSSRCGVDGAIQLADANTSDILESLGFVTATTSIKHPITNGATSDLFADSTSTIQTLLSLTSPPSGTITINGTNVTVNLAADSLSDIATRINSQVSGVTATVEQETVDGVVRSKLKIVGDSGRPTFADPDNVLCTLGILQKQIANQLQQAQDAEIIVDSITSTRPSNTISDLITGVTLNLLDADPAKTVRVQVSADAAAVQASVNDLINQFNYVMGLITDQLSYDPTTEETGTLFGEFTLVALQAKLRRLMTDPITGLAGEYTLPCQVGISSGTDDKLSLDSTAFLSAYTDDPDAIASLFKTVGTATDPNVSFVSAGHATQPTGTSPYAVYITSLATRATKTGNDISSGLAQAETLTINGAYVVSLQAGWTTQQVVDAINNIMAANNVEITAEADAGRVKLTHNYYGSNYTITIASTVGSGTPGSTGLGAAVPNETAIYAGTDVAGTINGEAATGKGQLLTGNAGNAHTDGLALLISGTATGDRGTVTLTKGIAARLDDLLHLFTSPNGLIDSRAQSLQEEVDYFGDQITELEQRLALEEERLYAKFVAMESALGALQRQSTWLSSQFATLLNLAPTRRPTGR